MTTFVTRETVRDSLVTLFTATAKWDIVYGHQPKTFDKRASALTIRSGGTRWEMAGLNTNPTAYRLILKSYLLVDDDTGNWDASETEDRLDEIDRLVRQTIRDNVASVSGADYLLPDDGASDTGYAIISGDLYRFEEWVVWAHYTAGS